MKISVIIPVYNRKEMVLNAVESVFNQNLKVHEIIVVDDGSTDGTSTLFPIDGVQYFKVKHSGFPGKVRNIGVEKATGDYIAFLDSDDIWHPQKIERQAEYFKNNPGTRILHTKELWLMNGKKVSQKKRKHKRAGDIFKDSLQGCIIGPSTVLMTKEIFNEYGGFREDIEVGEDYDLWLRITDSSSIDYLDEELITKNAGHGDQLSFKYGFIEPFKIRVLEELIKMDILKDNNRELATESLLTKYSIVINGCRKRGNETEAVQFEHRREEFTKWIVN